MKETISKLNFYLAFSSVFLIPFPIGLQTPILGLWLLFSILEFNFKERFALNFTKQNKKYFLLLLLFALLNFLSAILSSDSEKALKVIQPQLSLILLPILFLFANKNFYQKTNLIVYAFILGNLTVLSLNIFDAFYQSTNIVEKGITFQSSLIDRLNFWQSFKIGRNQFSYIHFTDFKHPTYFAVYNILSMGFIVNAIRNNQLNRHIGIALLTFSGVGIFFISSRAGMASLVFFILFTSFVYLRTRKKFILKYLLIVVTVIIATLLLFKVSRFDKTLRIKEDAKQKETRIELWEASLNLCLQKPIFGYGIGDIDKARNDYYLEIGMKDANKYGLNSHNQYLESQLNGGIFLLISLLLLLAIPLYYSYINKKYILSLFIVTIGFNFLLESMLERFQGVFFFCFFFLFLTTIYKSSKSI